MKKQLIILVLIFNLVACAKNTPVDYTIISGKIDNLTTEKLTIFNNYDGSNQHDIPVNTDGSFKDTFIAPRGLYTLIIGDNRIKLYLEKDNEVFLTADAKDFNTTLDISGKGSEISNYLLLKNKKIPTLKGDGKTFQTLGEQEFKKKAKKIYSTLSEIIDTLTGIPEYFKISEKRNLHYLYLNELINHESNLNFYDKTANYKSSKGFLSELEEVDYNNEDDFNFTNNYAYFQLLNFHYNKQIRQLMKSEHMEYGLATIKVNSQIPNTLIKNARLYHSARFEMDDAEDINEYYNQYMLASTNEANNVKITDIYNELKKISKGQPSPKFTNYENNAGGTLSLDDLKGKYIYIDVWATWCGPCIDEIPDLKRVEKEYHGKNIQFLSISIDNPKDHDKWKKMIVDKELSGIQVIADSAEGSTFIKDYKIQGIPRFILIDPEGTIVTPNAPRPSNPKLITLFNELNI